MHSRLEKPIISEERAETSAAVLIKFAFSVARSNKGETQERGFEEEELILDLSLKRRSLRKYKDYSWAFENEEKTDIFGMSADFKSDFSKTQTGFQIPKSGKWKMDLFWNRTRVNLENWWTTTTISRSFKITSRAKLNTEISKANSWFKLNGMQPNIKKTKHLLIGTAKKLYHSEITTLELFIDNAKECFCK